MIKMPVSELKVMKGMGAMNGGEGGSFVFACLLLLGQDREELQDLINDCSPFEGPFHPQLLLTKEF